MPDLQIMSDSLWGLSAGSTNSVPCGICKQTLSDPSRAVLVALYKYGTLSDLVDVHVA